MDPPGVLVPVFAVSLVKAGLLLALGNDNPMSPAYLFRHVPLLRAVRLFTGYQILIVLGVAILAAMGVAELSRRLRRGLFAGVALAVLVLLSAGPLLAQASVLIWRVGAVPHAWQLRRYDTRPFPNPAEMTVIERFRPFSRKLSASFGSQTVLLRRGYWIANCYSNLTLPGHQPRAPVTATIPLSNPPPLRIAKLGRDT